MAAMLQRWWLNQKVGWLMFFKKPAHAEEVLVQMLTINANDARARSMLSGMLAERGQTDAAMAHLKILEQQTPKDASVLFNIGFLHEQADRVGQAESYFRDAIELQPNIDRAWYGLGLVLIKQGRLTDALDALKRNTELQPMSPYGWYQLAMTHHHLGNDGEARNIRKHLENFEPKIARQLAHNLNSTPAGVYASAGAQG